MTSTGGSARKSGTAQNSGGKRGRLKRVLIALGVIAAAFATAIGGGLAWLWASADVSTVGKVPFDNALPVPPLAPSTVDKDGTRVFNLRMQTGETEFKDGQKTPTWGFNGSYLGPTLRAERGEKVKVRVTNSLTEPSTVHWHGMHLPARMDGGPHQTVAPGSTWTPRWTVDQPAATLWYHPHPHGATERHIQRGLAGMFLLDDDRASKLPLPKTYGVDDLPLIVQDVKFDGSRFDHGHGPAQSIGFLGDRTMVNGTLDPYREVGDERVRLRLLNASTARTYLFGFSDSRQFALIGTDGGLLAAPARMDRIQLSPGERAEIVVRMRPGEKTVLRSFPQDNYGGAVESKFAGGADSFDVLQLRAKPTLRPSPELPAAMGEPETPEGTSAARHRHFDLQRGGINGRPMAMDRIDETVTRGTEEIWTVRNTNGMPHNFHIHDAQFRVLELNGSTPPPHLRGPKDTIFLPHGTTAKLALRFNGPADPNTPYMYHCHLLSHEDGGMMGQFVVVDRGERAGAQAGQGGAEHDGAGHRGTPG